MIRTIIEAVILGIVQGVAEFAPISSSAHLIIVPWLFGWDNPALSGLSFDVALHLGTLAAVLIYFWGDLWRLLKAGFAGIFQWRIGDDHDRRLAWYIVLATIPAVLVGYFIEDMVDAAFHASGVDIPANRMLTLAAMLAGVALVMLFVDTVARHTRPLTRMRLIDALIVGLAQTLALFPGVSRSGSTIIAGLALGFERAEAARFSFLLAVPVTLGAGLRGVWALFQEWQATLLTNNDLLVIAVGVLSAAISGFLCIHFLLRFLRRSSLSVFVIYRIVLAVIVAFVALAR